MASELQSTIHYDPNKILTIYHFNPVLTFIREYYTNIHFSPTTINEYI